ncbi:lysophospholipid acyltransferase family protein [Aquimarina brevivitae]|uniref:1-acyl-sn-glycerol-3-phosphate acyltransferase n=1 Tax=Aquimarina brevivitae TaxID=323412 RepID=A0A4Q7PF63_9FLAO|nr:lysophospholipid acyltransferase family protein [Aquimarina brevivitae]RZS99094.1 1-acyl-sn-glycerol-3-phosphate acyltransferase [Aquimarina brevivitae]
MLKKLISYPFSILFYLVFGLILVVFHPLQWLALQLGGRSAHNTVVNYLNLSILGSLSLLGVYISFRKKFVIPQGKPLIIVSNHQSMFDIPLITWALRKHYPKFISKIELGKGIPSISFNLRHGGNALIDRKNPKQSIPELIRFSNYVKEHKYAAVIFPEGTRSRNGQPKNFAGTGLKVLFKHIPDAVVVPVAINNSWKLLRYGNFPMGIGIHLTLTIEEPIAVSELSPDHLIENIQQKITQNIIKK